MVVYFCVVLYYMALFSFVVFIVKGSVCVCLCFHETLRLEPKLLVTRWRHLWAVALNLSSCAYVVCDTVTKRKGKKKIKLKGIRKNCIERESRDILFYKLVSEKVTIFSLSLSWILFFFVFFLCFWYWKNYYFFFGYLKCRQISFYSQNLFFLVFKKL